ncbi:MAG: ATP phosphoribosyltransferase [Saprospiraceae bacterium]|nr:ATP phosphoribosyltransferase [Saprospiraceae bacterium]
MQSLKVAVQKSGRLSEKSLELFRECGIKLPNGERKLRSSADNFPLEILFLRDDDIPQYVEQGVVDAGILGENEVLENGKQVELIDRLGFARCRLVLAIPKEAHYPGLHFFKGKKIATSYPCILRQFFENQGIPVEIEAIGGSVEIAPGIGLADAVFDIVSTGSTLLLNGLKPVETVLHSEAVLIARPGLDPARQALLERLCFRMRAVRQAAAHKYILLNAPDAAIPAICALLPGMKAPTLLPLAEPGWSSLHSVVQEDRFWDVIDQLKALGAEGILVASIEKMVI